jgi:hypothetical protein
VTTEDATEDDLRAECDSLWQQVRDADAKVVGLRAEVEARTEADELRSAVESVFREYEICGAGTQWYFDVLTAAKKRGDQ